MGLNARQRIFVKEYLKDRNATQAAIRAGYSKKTAGSIGDENLKKPEIKKAVEEGIAKLEKKLDISAERILGRIAEFAFDKKGIRESDTLKACELLGKHQKLFTDVQEIGGKDGGPVVVLTMPANGSEKAKE